MSPKYVTELVSVSGQTLTPSAQTKLEWGKLYNIRSPVYFECCEGEAGDKIVRSLRVISMWDIFVHLIRWVLLLVYRQSWVLVDAVMWIQQYVSFP